MTHPLVLKCAKRRHWLLLERGRYRRIMPSALRLRLREIGLGWCATATKGQLRPSEIVARYGAIVSRSIFDAAEQGGAP